MSTESQDSTQVQTETKEVTAQDVMDLIGANSDSPNEEVQASEENIEPKSKVEEKVEKEEQVDKFAPKFAALSRQEKALKAQARTLAAREAALAEREKALSAPKEQEKVKEQEPLEFRLKKDTFGTLKELGLTPEMLVQMMLNDGKPTQELQMQLLKDEVSRSSKSEMEQLKAELAEIKKDKEEQRRQQEEAEQQKLINGFKSQIKDFVAKDLEKYDLINVEDDYGIDLIYNVIAEDAQRKQEELGDEFTGDEIMSIEEAAQKIEEQLFQEAKKRIERSKKAKSLLGNNQVTQSTTPGKKASVTLSNNIAQEQSRSRAPMSDDERIAAAAAMLKKASQ
jgi:hypothetical protein